MTARQAAPPAPPKPVQQAIYRTGFCQVGNHGLCPGTVASVGCVCTCHRPPTAPEHAWDRYKVLVAVISNGPDRVMAHDDLDDSGQRPIRELTLSVYLDLYCGRCDTEIAALEPEDVDLLDVVSVIAAHEPACVPAPSWGGDADG